MDKQDARNVFERLAASEAADARHDTEIANIVKSLNTLTAKWDKQWDRMWNLVYTLIGALIICTLGPKAADRLMGAWGLGTYPITYIAPINEVDLIHKG